MVETSTLLRSVSGETFTFDPGAVCLTFALTGGEGERAAYETLTRPADLERWSDAALGVGVEKATGSDFAAAKRLREAIWHLALARVEGAPLPGEHVGEVNRAAAAPPLVPQIDPDGQRAVATPVTVGQALSTLARDAVELFTGPLAYRIRRCAGTNCTLIFADTSRPGRRRWCSMERCGNRAKVGNFRTRQGKEEA
ncbi:MAG TPA: ABATE domain-containing protein [Acidimicrobiales bacterium]|nr:ABATE domain-containing protein [Acidimicrobiales bacterium]